MITKIQVIWRKFGIFILVFLTVAASRWWLIQHFASNLPFSDQWDSEAVQTYIPWLSGHFNWAALLIPQNEHRIFFTHLQNLLLLTVNSGWDPLLQMVVNSGWSGLAAGILAHLNYQAFGDSRRYWAVGLVTLICIAPFGWENTLWGFQSHSYFGILLPLVALTCLSSCLPYSARWWTGVVAAAASLIATGAGPVSNLALALTFVFLGIAKHLPWRTSAPTAVALLMIVVAGLALATVVPAHAVLHAKSLHTLLNVFAICLAWPNLEQPLIAILAWLPLTILCALSFFRRKNLSNSGPMWLPIGLGALAFLHAASIAYARGEALYEGRPLSRYQDLLAWGAIANGLALLYLKPAPKTKSHLHWRLFVFLWLASLTIGLTEISLINFRLNLPFKLLRNQWTEANLTAYVRTRDPAALYDKTVYEIGHPSARVVQQVIDNRVLFPYLPGELSGAASSQHRLQPIVKFILSVSTICSCVFFLCLLILLIRKKSNDISQLVPESDLP